MKNADEAFEMGSFSVREPSFICVNLVRLTKYFWSSSSSMSATLPVWFYSKLDGEFSIFRQPLSLDHLAPGIGYFVTVARLHWANRQPRFSSDWS